MPANARDALTDYLADLAQLKLAIDHNIGDYSSNNQIIYVVDHNVVRLFLDPYSNRRIVAPFRRLAKHEPDNELLTTAVLTAEHIFSRRLAGQLGYPVYLSRNHADELLDYLTGDPVSETKTHSNIAALENIVQKASAILHKHSAKTADFETDILVKFFAEEIPAAIDKISVGKLPALLQYNRLMHEGLIRPLSSAPLPQSGRKPLDQEAVQDWRNALEYFVADGADRSSHSHILERDAQTMAEIIALNQSAENMKSPVKIVLISDDAKLHLAAAYLDHGTGKFSDCLRRSLQYCPMLNYNEMGSMVAHSQLIYHLKAVIDAIMEVRLPKMRPQQLLFAVANSTKLTLEEAKSKNRSILEPEWKLTLKAAWKAAIEQTFTIEISESVTSEIAAANGNWRAVVRAGIAPNIKLLAHRFDQEFKPLMRVLEKLRNEVGEDKLSVALRNHELTLVKQIAASHLEWQLISLVCNFIRAQGKKLEPPRAPVLSRLAGFIKVDDERIDRFIDGGLEGSLDLVDFEDRLRQAFRKLGFAEAFAFAAVLSIRIADWLSASEYCGRAIEILSRATDDKKDGGIAIQRIIGELSYLKAMALRFTLGNDINCSETSVGDSLFRKADEIHKIAIAAYDQNWDLFGASRGRAERGTLYLTMAMVEFLGNRPRTTAQEYAQIAAQDLSDAFSDATTYV
ncbi:MAG: hypothetical protein WAX57_01825, partial [Minisyncoccia bacterium]